MPAAAGGALYLVFAGAARVAARHRPDAAREPGVVRPVPSRRAAAALVLRFAAAARGRARRLHEFRLRALAHRPLPPSQPSATASRPTGPCSRSSRAACSARAGRGHHQDGAADAHTDFIFAVVAEEYGVLACLVLVGLFAPGGGACLLPGDADEPDAFARLAGGRAGAPVRAAGGDQHRGQCRSRPGQGHDTALHLQRRLIHAGGRSGDRHAAGRDAALRRPRAREKARIRVYAGTASATAIGAQP